MPYTRAVRELGAAIDSLMHEAAHTSLPITAAERTELLEHVAALLEDLHDLWTAHGAHAAVAESIVALRARAECHVHAMRERVLH